MTRVIFVMFCMTILWSCQKTTIDAQDVIDKAIEVSGGEAYNSFDLEFDFRDKHYRVKRDGGIFQYERIFKDSILEIKDVLNNDGFRRYVNDSLIVVADSLASKYASSVNSVPYFILLPFGLNDAAVNKTYLEETTINGHTYHKIQVTFNEEGGGEDFDDVFVYWINAKTFKPDYLAYSYSEKDGTGLRFREAFNERYVDQIRFVDYNNYKPKSREVKVQDLDLLYEKGELELLSKIENTNIRVN